MPTSIAFAKEWCPNCEDEVTISEYLRTYEHYAGCSRCGLHFWTISSKPHVRKTIIRRYGRNYEVKLTRRTTTFKEIK